VSSKEDEEEENQCGGVDWLYAEGESAPSPFHLHILATGFWETGLCLERCPDNLDLDFGVGFDFGVWI